MIYSSWGIEENKLKLVILGHFLPFIRLKNPKNQTFEKMKTFARDIIILHMCTKNHNHMTYGSWDTEWDRQKSLSFWVTFCPFTSLPPPPHDPEHQNFEQKFKKCLHILSFYTYMCTINEDHDIWFRKYDVQQTEIFDILGHLFALSSPWQTGKSKF